MAKKRRIGGYINSNNFIEHFILPFFAYVVQKSRLMEVKLRRTGSEDRKTWLDSLWAKIRSSFI
jgi:hypothetical protein